MPPHHPACMRARCDAPVALLPPPSAPVPPNPVAFDHGIYPFDFARTGFDQWTSPPGCVRSAHRNTLEQHQGQTHSRIPPCRPHASVSPLQVPTAAPSMRGHTPDTRAGRLQPPQHFQTCERIWRHVLAPGVRGHSRRHAKSNPRRGKCSDTSPPQKTMKNYHQSYITCAHVV